MSLILTTKLLVKVRDVYHLLFAGPAMSTGIIKRNLASGRRVGWDATEPPKRVHSSFDSALP